MIVDKMTSVILIYFSAALGAVISLFIMDWDDRRRRRNEEQEYLKKKQSHSHTHRTNGLRLDRSN